MPGLAPSRKGVGVRRRLLPIQKLIAKIYREFRHDNEFEKLIQYEHVNTNKAETEMTCIAFKEDGFRILNRTKAGKKAERIAKRTLQDTLPGVLEPFLFFFRYWVEVEILGF